MLDLSQQGGLPISRLLTIFDLRERRMQMPNVSYGDANCTTIPFCIYKFGAAYACEERDPNGIDGVVNG